MIRVLGVAKPCPHESILLDAFVVANLLQEVGEGFIFVLGDVVRINMASLVVADTEALSADDSSDTHVVVLVPFGLVLGILPIIIAPPILALQHEEFPHRGLVLGVAFDGFIVMLFCLLV